MISTRPDSAAGTADPLVGQSISGYRVVKEVGRGGMGVVYEAVHETAGQRAAVKVLFAELAENPDHVDRFLAEARAASAVSHPGLVKVFSCGRMSSQVPYIIME